MRPKHIMVVFFFMPSSRELPLILGRYRAFWSLCQVSGKSDSKYSKRTSSRINTLGAIHVFPPCFRVIFKSWKYPLLASLILQATNRCQNTSLERNARDVQMSPLLYTLLRVQ
jgi:hypothetical protein